MKKINVLVALFFATTSVFAQGTIYKVDKAHSSLGFSISHLLISEVDGSFGKFDATLTASKEDFSDAVVELTADATTINTNNEGRDKHLKSADFFEVEKYPTVTFKSTSFQKTGEKTYKVTGDLTMHGVTKTVTLDATLTGTAVGRGGKKVVAFKTTGVVKRSEFGIGKNGTSPGDDVTIIAKTEFNAQ